MRLKFAALVLVVGAALSSPAKPLTISLDWARTPTAEEMRRAYPTPARAKGIEGMGVFSCAVGTAGRLHDCQVEDETPAGFGFGAAAVRLAPRFVLRTEPGNKPSSRQHVRVPVRFHLDAEVVKRP